jgi:two-component system OmpR family sensor kinase
VSLRARLVVAVGGIAVVALIIADVATYSALQSFLNQRIDQQLDRSHHGYEVALNGGRLIPCAPGTSLFPLTGDGAPPPGPSPGGGEGFNAIQITAVEVRTPAGALVTAVETRNSSGALVSGQVCPAYQNGTAYTPLLPHTITGFSTNAQGEKVSYFTAASTKAGGPSFRVRASTLDNGNLLILAQPLNDTASTLHQLLLIELAVTGGAVLVALVGGFWLVRLGLRPLRDMETTAESIADGNLTERVPGENESTEVGRLARTLNVMLTRIEAAFSARLASERRLRASEQQLRQFVADASHELRTPIAAISAYAELFERGASEQKEDLERLLGGIRTETARMEHLVADLLLLARLDEGRPMERHSVDLVALCAEAVHTASTVGPEWPVTFEASTPVEMVGDATRLRQVMDNLLANVRAHTPPGTRARVKVEPDDGQVVVTVADDGPGMDPEESEHVFERFYRSDPSRSRTHGGAGLGLSIVSAIVAAHHGTVAAEGRSGSGTTFTVRLPRTPPTADPVPEEAMVVGPSRAQLELSTSQKRPRSAV